MISFLPYLKLQLLLLLFLQCIELYQTQSEQPIQVHYLGQFKRSNDTELNDEGYVIDVYFGCAVNGSFVHWKYQDAQLSGFRMGQVGVTRMRSFDGFNYTATLISSKRLPHDSANEALHSMLIMTFQGAPPTTLPVTCTSNRNYATLNAINHYSRFRNSNGTVNNILLNYVLLYIANPQNISIFLCEASYEQQLVDASGLLIGFSRYDSVGKTRTLYSQDRTYATMHGILLSRTISRTLSIVFVPHSDSNMKVACYYDTLIHGVSILTGSQSTSQEEPPTTESIRKTLGPSGTNPATSIMPGFKVHQSNATNTASSILKTEKPTENISPFLYHATTGVSEVTLILTLILSSLILIILFLFAYVYFVKHRKHISGKYSISEEVISEIRSEHYDLPLKQDDQIHVKQIQQDNVRQDQQDHVTCFKKNIVCGCSWSMGSMLPVKPEWKLQDHLRVANESLESLKTGSLQDAFKNHLCAPGDNQEEMICIHKDWALQNQVLQTPVVDKDEESIRVAELQDDRPSEILFAQLVHGNFSKLVLMDQGIVTCNTTARQSHYSRMIGMDLRNRKIVN